MAPSPDATRPAQWLALKGKAVNFDSMKNSGSLASSEGRDIKNGDLGVRLTTHMLHGGGLSQGKGERKWSWISCSKRHRARTISAQISLLGPNQRRS